MVRHLGTLTSVNSWWCENNGLTDILAKFIEADGNTIKPQYVTADNGLETDHRAAMSLHKWQPEDNDALLSVTMRIGPGGDMQLRSRVTILSSHITMHVKNDNAN
eukprot:4536669-Amphidinium_carterae.2